MTNPTGALFSRSFELQKKEWHKKPSESDICGDSVVGKPIVFIPKCMMHCLRDPEIYDAIVKTYVRLPNILRAIWTCRNICCQSGQYRELA